jgi:hypothetical protein
LTGQVCSAARRDAAEVAAASIPQVRGIANDLQAPDAVGHPKHQQFWQPRIGEDVYAVDMMLGHVTQVVVNPSNRCVTAFVTHGLFPDLNQKVEQTWPDEAVLPERDVVIPTSAILYDGESSIRLLVCGALVAHNPDLSASDYLYPPEEWQPPYPYHPGDVIFEREGFEKMSQWAMSPFQTMGISARSKWK